MAKTEKKKVQQTELAFQMPVAPGPIIPDDGGVFCPIYYLQAGGGLKDLARRMAPVLARTGWVVRVVEGEEKFLEIQNKNGQRRRLSPEEALAWQVLLPELSGWENLFSSSEPLDRKE